ncbi:MAG: hypothetical protein K9H64_08545 [Bacteroidales bacterium]|nr:hypothetical protein [Bacteroidales bacterium]MCF8455880.1 hypothetical protein [Bacteroidales bacterium]
MKTKAIIILLVSSFSLFAQIENDSIPLADEVVRLQFMPIGLSYEKQVNEYSSRVFEFGASMQMDFLILNAVVEFPEILTPIVSAEYRFYRIRKQAISKKPKKDFYSGFYVSGKISALVLLSEGLEPLAIATPMIGYQHKIGKRAFWNMALGYGLTYFDYEIIITPTIDLNFGVTLQSFQQ